MSEKNQGRKEFIAHLRRRHGRFWWLKHPRFYWSPSERCTFVASNFIHVDVDAIRRKMSAAKEVKNGS